MTTERSNTKIYIQGGNKLSDYERKVRSSVTQRPIYNDQIVGYVHRKVTDPILKDRVLAEVARYPSQASNFLLSQIDSIIIKKQEELTKEKADLNQSLKKKDKQEIPSADKLSDLYDSLSQEDLTSETLENNITAE